MTEKGREPAVIESDAGGETERKPQAPSGEQAFYEIKVKGHLDSHWSEWFDDLTLTHHEDGTTVLSGPVIDQAALHGLLNKVRDLGLKLLSVNRVEPDDKTSGLHENAPETIVVNAPFVSENLIEDK